MTTARTTALAQLDKARAAIERCSVSEAQEVNGQIKAVLAYMKTKKEKSLGCHPSSARASNRELASSWMSYRRGSKNR